MTALVVAHLLVGLLVLASGGRLGRWAVAIGAAPMLVGVVALATRIGPVLDGDRPSEHVAWVASLDVGFSFRLDAFALLVALLVTGIGVLVLLYSSAYFGEDATPAYLARFTGCFVAFGGAMLGLVLADDVWTLFVFWEITSITSFLLIGLDDRQAVARSSAQRALLVTSAGGLAMLGGFALLSATTGMTSFDGIAGRAGGGATVQIALVLVLLGAATKSAQVPFHFWLPGAMAAPTPVSAYLHSATMVKAGVVLVARLAPVYASFGWWRPALVVVGGTTMLVGGLRALRQHDLKLLLAHGTVSQLGLLMVLLGSGIPDVTAAGVAVLLAHALFKAPLFLIVGAVDHATGTRDLRRLDGVGRAMPLVAVLAALAGLSMVGLPPMLGFPAKEAALDALLEADGGWATAALVLVALGSVLTVAYTVRFWWGAFGDKHHPTDAAHVHHAPSPTLVAPIAVLVAAGLLGGLAASPLGDRLAHAGEALDPASHGHLTLWAGVHAPLVLSVAIVVGGLALAAVRGRLPQLETQGWPSGERTYQALFDGLLRGSKHVIATIQNGSLPAYVAVSFLAIVGAVGAGVAQGGGGDLDALIGADHAAQAVVATIAAALAVATVAVHRRFTAVMLLGGAGYALALIYLLYGAPDLALTQLLVETLSVVVFLLVLRHLPDGYRPAPSWAPRTVRLAIAVAVGVAMASLAVMAGTTRTDRPVTDEIAQRAEHEAGGRNLVNVTIVDFRGIDTLYEITVLATAMVGVANLVRAARRLGRRDEPAAVRGRLGETRSVIFDEVARILFWPVIVVSLYIAFRGHNAPGGGFAGGLIAGAGFVVRHLSGGSPRLAHRWSSPPTALMASGLLIAAGTGATGLLDGGELMESWIWEPHLPLVGHLHVVSAGIFDVGVYLLVLGAVLTVIAHLGPSAADEEAVPS